MTTTVTRKRSPSRRKRRSEQQALLKRLRLNLAFSGKSPIDWSELAAMSAGGGRPLEEELEEGDRATYPAPVSLRAHRLCKAYQQIAADHEVPYNQRTLGMIAGYCIEQMVAGVADISDPAEIAKWLDSSPLGAASPERSLSDAGYNIRIPLEYRRFIKGVSWQKSDRSGIDALDTWVLTAIIEFVLAPSRATKEAA